MEIWITLTHQAIHTLDNQKGFGPIGDNMKFEEFKRNVEHWAEVRGIYTQSTEYNQVEKFKEEHWEFVISSNQDEMMDAIGDMAVCIVNAAKLQVESPELKLIDQGGKNYMSFICVLVYEGQYSRAIQALRHFANTELLSAYFEDCLQIAWDEIKDRKGMMINGLFVKWENLTTNQREELQARLDSHIEANC